MDIAYQHRWPETTAEAYKIQEAVLERVIIDGNTDEPETIAAVDTAYGHGGERIYAVAVAMRFPSLEEVERVYSQAEVSFPYHPGLFFFREGRVIIDALSRLQCDVDLILSGSHGIAHPNRCGLACHLGVAFDRPTIGCARRILVGEHRPVGEAKGMSQPIAYRNREVGIAYRSKDNVKPIFISPAHRCDLNFARDITVRSLRGFRLPEPLRIAHLLANKHKRFIEKKPRKHQPRPA